jgi:hypothetical protein
MRPRAIDARLMSRESDAVRGAHVACGVASVRCVRGAHGELWPRGLVADGARDRARSHASIGDAVSMSAQRSCAVADVGVRGTVWHCAPCVTALCALCAV